MTPLKRAYEAYWSQRLSEAPAGRGEILETFAFVLPPVDTADFVADVSALKAATGWQPEIGLRDGVALTHEYYEAHRRWYWE
jgi:nucleoside-diphosphate-sugar epimerase